jgi:hypothetical protein
MENDHVNTTFLPELTCVKSARTSMFPPYLHPSCPIIPAQLNEGLYMEKTKRQRTWRLPTQRGVSGRTTASACPLDLQKYKERSILSTTFRLSNTRSREKHLTWLKGNNLALYHYQCIWIWTRHKRKCVIFHPTPSRMNIYMGKSNSPPLTPRVMHPTDGYGNNSHRTPSTMQRSLLPFPFWPPNYSRRNDNVKHSHLP